MNKDVRINRFVEIVKRCIFGVLIVLGNVLGALPAAAAILEVVPLNQVVETGGSASIAVRLSLESGDNPADCQITGTLTTADGSATSGSDYQTLNTSFSLNLVDPAGTVEQQFTVAIVNDTVGEPTESFDATIAETINPALCPLTVFVTKTTAISIADDDPPTGGGPIVLNGAAGQTVTSTFVVTGLAPITLGAQLGTVTPNTLPAPGNATYSFTVPVGTPSGTVFNDTITLTDATGIQSTKQVTIQVATPLAGIAGLTPNQLALAAWFDSFCPRIAQAADTPDEQDLNTICNNLKDPRTSTAETVAALDAINGEELIGSANMVLRLMGQQHGNLSQRINALRSGASGIDLAGLSINASGQQISGSILQEMLDGITGGAASADDFGRWGLFVNGRVNFGEKDQTDDQVGFDFDTIGITSGVDYRLQENFIVGGSIGYTKLEADFDNSGGSIDIDSWNGSLYGTYFVADAFYADASLSYGDSSYDSSRHIVYTDIGGTVDRTAKGDTDGTQAAAGIAAGYDFNNGPWTFGPHVGTYYVNVDADSYDEEGAGGLNLAVGDQNAESFTVNGGAHLSRVFTPGWGVLIPHLRVDYVHEFEDSRELIEVGIAADPFSADPLDPTPPIKLQTDRPDPDYAVWSAGVSAQFINGLSGFVNYQGTAGYSDLTLSEVTYGLRWERSF
jgi:outer membrane autotransporter protein